MKEDIDSHTEEKWLEFVTPNRLGKDVWKGYDYVEGGVANDRIINTVRLYMTGFISAEEAYQPMKPSNASSKAKPTQTFVYLCAETRQAWKNSFGKLNNRHLYIKSGTSYFGIGRR